MSKKSHSQKKATQTKQTQQPQETQPQQTQKTQQTQDNKDTDESLDEILKGITLKKGRNPYTIFITEMFHMEKEKDNDFTLAKAAKMYSPKWKTMPPEEKEKYTSLSKQEKEKYEKDMRTVKNKLIKFNGREGATAYRLYADDYVRTAFENDRDIKKAKHETRENWRKMKAKDKKKWEEESEKNDDWWKNAKKIGPVSAYSMFVQRKIAQDANLDFKRISELWKKVTNKEKKKYQSFADEITKERKEMRDAYEIAYGIKPKKPAGALKTFIQEMAKEGRLPGNGLKEGIKLWEALKEEEKEKYLNLSHRQSLLYIYKKKMFKESQKKKVNKTSKPLTAYNFFLSELKNEDKPKKMNFFEWARTEWEKLDSKGKEKFELKAKEMKEAYQQEKTERGNRVFDSPKRACSHYGKFISERMSALIKENPEEKTSVLMSQCAAEWNKLPKEEKKKYNKEIDIDRKRYERQKEEYEEKGYYTLSEKDKETRLSQSQKKRSQRESSQSKKEKSIDKTKEKSRSKSKGKAKGKSNS